MRNLGEREPVSLADAWSFNRIRWKRLKDWSKEDLSSAESPFCLGSLRGLGYSNELTVFKCQTNKLAPIHGIFRRFKFSKRRQKLGKTVILGGYLLN